MTKTEFVSWAKHRGKTWRNDERCFSTKEAAEHFATFARPHSKFALLDRSKNYRIRKVGRNWRIQDFI